MKMRGMAALAAFAMCLSLSLPANAATLRMGHHHAVGGMIDKTANKFAELVKEKTNGEVTIQIIPGAQLGQERELFDLLNNNGVDATLPSLGHMDSYWGPITVTSYPFAFRDWQHARKALAGALSGSTPHGVTVR